MQMCLIGLFVVCIVHAVRGGSITTELGHSVTFATDKDCKAGDNLRLVTRVNSVNVAIRSNSVWRPAPGYEARIKHDSLSSVVLTNVNYNDGGLYEFMCGGDVVDRVQLKVLVSMKVSATEGDTVTLHCFAATHDASLEQIRWERNKTLVLELNTSSGQTRAGPGFEGRVNLPADWKQTGYLSLTLERVQPEDQGLFLCRLVKKGPGSWGEPAAMKLLVTERITVGRPGESNSANITSTEYPTQEDNRGEIFWMRVAIVAIVAIVALIVGVAVWKWRPRARRGDPPTDRVDAELEPFTNGGSPVNAGPSRNDSNGYNGV